MRVSLEICIGNIGLRATLHLYLYYTNAVLHTGKLWILLIDVLKNT